MRALRDFNTPKIYMEDVPIFMGLIGDLFPALNVPRKRDMEFEACVKKSVLVCGGPSQFTMTTDTRHCTGQGHVQFW